MAASLAPLAAAAAKGARACVEVFVVLVFMAWGSVTWGRAGGSMYRRYR